MKKDRAVFLLGAGAAMAWGGPSTDFLTRKTILSGFQNTKGEFVTQKIFDLLNNGDEPDFKRFNFETIISVLDDFLVYFADSRVTPNKKSFLNLFFNPIDIDIFGGFTFPPEFALHQKMFHGNFKNKEQVYIQELISILMQQIHEIVYEYTEYYDGKLLSNELNSFFISWLWEFKRHSFLRMYTLNYENITKVICETYEKRFNFFEGFKYSHDYSYSQPDPLSIINEFDIDCHYNLHGSIFWKVENVNKSGKIFPRIFLKQTAYSPLNNRISLSQSERGKIFSVQSLITGYSKLQKTHITPYRQMRYAFEKDCLIANQIFLIGYSFGDEHINSAIGEAIKYNNALKIILIDPGFEERKKDIKLFLRDYDFELVDPLLNDIDKIYSYSNDRFSVYKMTFEDYLKGFAK